MIFLCNFTEYGSNNGISMKEKCQSEPYEGKEKIVSYLKNNGMPTVASGKMTVDRFTGERVKGELGIVHYSDGKYSWCSDLAYYVEKYNLRLPKEFEEYVLHNH